MFLKKGGRRPPFKKTGQASENRISLQRQHKAGQGVVFEKKMAEGHLPKRPGKRSTTGEAQINNTRRGKELFLKKVAEGHLSKRRGKRPTTGEA